MEGWLINPATVFIIILVLLFILNKLLKGLAFRSQKNKPGCCKSYACGESNYDSTAHPDYSVFFPVAFFFTLAHVATLMITTLPKAFAGALVMASLYIVGGIIGLYILLRK